jgi:tetratricopeptide (TPR) repeat protein
MELYAEALNDHKRAVELDPQNIVALYSLALDYCFLGQPEKAILSFDDATKLTQQLHLDFPEMWSARGEVLYGMGRYNESRESFQKVLSINNKSAPAWNGLGLSLLALKESEAAAKALNQAVELDPGNEIYHYNLGVSYHRQGKIDSAKQEISEALKLKPNFKRAKQALETIGRAKPRDWWEWWLNKYAPLGRRIIAVFLLVALLALVVFPLIYLVLPLIYGHYGPDRYEPGLDWQYYLVAVAVILITLLSPFLRAFKFGPVEGELQPDETITYQYQLEPVLPTLARLPGAPPEILPTDATRQH